MKKYIFLIPQIGNIGGGQLYLRNKILYLQSKGWIVDFVYSYNDNVIINELKGKGIKNLYISYSSYLFSKRRIIRVVDQLYNIVYSPSINDYVIESTCLQQSLWGEMLASKLGAKHIIYLLQENNILVDKNWLDFYKFKYERRELVGIQRTSLLKLFQGSSYNINSSYWLNAYCTNVVDSYKHELVDIINSKKYDFKVGCISRLDKPFLRHALLDFLNYCKEHPEKKFLLLVIGGAAEDEKRVKSDFYSIYNNQSNVEMIITGNMFPISRSLIRMCDVFFSSAGSAEITKNEGIPTISYDANDYKPIGIFGYTTNNTIYRSNEPEVDLSSLLNEILFAKRYVKDLVDLPNNELSFQDHLDFIENSEKNKMYFNILNFTTLTRKDKKLKLLLNILGIPFYNSVAKVKNKIIWKIKQQ